MKSIILPKLLALLALLPVAAETAQAGKKPAEQDWSATLMSMNPRNNTITARNWMVTRTFSLSPQCTVSSVEKPEAALADLCPGEEITIGYHRSNGALVADSVAEHVLRCTGTVASVHPKAGFVAVSEASALGAVSPHKGFRFARDCTVILRDGTSGSLKDLNPGDRITIVYGLPDGFPIAYRIHM